jgi:hypothetical protein
MVSSHPSSSSESTFSRVSTEYGVLFDYFVPCFLDVSRARPLLDGRFLVQPVKFGGPASISHHGLKVPGHHPAPSTQHPSAIIHHLSNHFADTRALHFSSVWRKIVHSSTYGDYGVLLYYGYVATSPPLTGLQQTSFGRSLLRSLESQQTN